MSEVKKKVKHPEVTIGEEKYLRIPIKTHVILRDDVLLDVVEKYAKPSLEDGDILFITEKIVAVTQGRAIKLTDIKPRPLAKMLAYFVTKTPAGIGLGMPETMEMALQECGRIKILYAALASAVTRPFGKRGVFYEIAGYKASSIDGPTPNTLPPYNQYVVLGPDRPDQVAEDVKEFLGASKVVVVDINDLSGNVLGASDKDIDKDLIVKILKDNPLGQDHEQTPLGIIRKI